MPTIATALRAIAAKSRIASSLPPSFADKSLVAMTLANGPAPDCAALHPDLRQLPDRACSPHERSDMRVRYVRKPVPDIASLIRASSWTERLQNQPESPTSSLTSEFHCGALARRYRRPSSGVGRSTNTRGHDLFNGSTGAAGFPRLAVPSAICWENYRRRPRCLIHFSSVDLDPKHDLKAFCRCPIKSAKSMASRSPTRSTPSTSLFRNGLCCNSAILQRDIGGWLISRKGRSRSLVLCPSSPSQT